MGYETQGGVPTKGLTFSKLVDHLRQAEECAYMLAHLHADESEVMCAGWRACGDMFKLLIDRVTKLATSGRLQ